MILRRWIFLGILAVVGNARHFYDDLVRDDSGATHQSVQRFLRAMNRLNFIEGKLLDVEEVKSPSSIPYLDDLFAAHDEHGNPQRVLASQDKPEEKPFLFEGDMLLTSKQMDEIVMNVEHQLFLKDIGKPELMMRNRFKRTLTSNIISRWTEMRIPYRIHPERGPNRTLIEAGIKAWTDATCLEFEEKTGGLLQPHIVFIKGSGCYSNVGKSSINGQYISIGRGCENPYIVAHEIGHTLGFFHEQGRYDRDGHINIAPKNIHVGFLSQFTKQDPESMTTLSVPYDVGSVMHYDQYSFSYNGHPSIRAIDPNYQMTMGQRQELTFNDVKKINLAYCPFRCLLKLDCQYSGYTDPKDCSKCRCPSGLSGQKCSKPVRTESKCGRLYHTATSEIKTLSFEGKGECNFLIKAKEGVKIRLHWEKLFIFESQPCQNSYVEIKYHKDLGTTGARFCSTDIKQKDINSAISTVLVLYRSKSLFTSFKLTFSSDEPAPTRNIFSQSMAYFSNFFHSIFHSEKDKNSDESDNFINSSNEEYDEEEPVNIDDDKKKVSGVVQQRVPDEKKKLTQVIDETVLPKSGEKLVPIKKKVDEKDKEEKDKEKVAIEGMPDENWVAEAESSIEDDKEVNNGTVGDIIILNDDKREKVEEINSTRITIRDEVSNTTPQTETIVTAELMEPFMESQTNATIAATSKEDTSTALPDASTESETQLPATTSKIAEFAEAENKTMTEMVEIDINVTEVSPMSFSGEIISTNLPNDSVPLTETVSELTSTTSESIPEQEEEETVPLKSSEIPNDRVTPTTVDYTSIGIEIRRAQAKNSNEIIEIGSGDDTDLIEYTVQREEEVLKSSAKSSTDEILEALKAEPDLIFIPSPQPRECKNNVLSSTPHPISTATGISVDQSTVLISHSVDEITHLPLQDADELIEGSGIQ